MTRWTAFIAFDLSDSVRQMSFDCFWMRVNTVAATHLQVRQPDFVLVLPVGRLLRGLLGAASPLMIMKLKYVYSVSMTGVVSVLLLEHEALKYGCIFGSLARTICHSIGWKMESALDSSTQLACSETVHVDWLALKGRWMRRWRLNTTLRHRSDRRT